MLLRKTTSGLCTTRGRGVPQDYTQAALWYRKAAEQGNAEAQYDLGALYVKGQGVPQDYAQAALWYRKAAEQGDAEAQWRLGGLYYEGPGRAPGLRRSLLLVRSSGCWQAECLGRETGCEVSETKPRLT